MSESKLAEDLQRTANIDKLKDVHARVKYRERREIALDKADEADELNFDDDLMESGNE